MICWHCQIVSVDWIVQWGLYITDENLTEDFKSLCLLLARVQFCNLFLWVGSARFEISLLFRSHSFLFIYLFINFLHLDEQTKSIPCLIAIPAEPVTTIIQHLRVCGDAHALSICHSESSFGLVGLEVPSLWPCKQQGDVERNELKIYCCASQPKIQWKIMQRG